MNGKLLSALSKILFVLFLFSIGDTILYMALDSRGAIRTLPGSKVYVVGETAPDIGGGKPLPEDSDDPEKAAERRKVINENLTYSTDTEGIRLDFHTLKGKMWQGELTVDKSVKPGAHLIRVERAGESLAGPGLASSEQPAPLEIKVFANSREYHDDFWSLTERYLGAGPWWITIAIIPMAAVILFLVYREGDREDERLRRKGLGPIYKLAKRKGGWDIIFGLGLRQGVAEGERMSIVDRDGREVVEIVAANVGPDAAKAFVATDRRLQPDYLVMRKGVAL